MILRPLGENSGPIYPEAGDIVGFSGSNWVSKAITLGTYGWPGWGISHVGIVGNFGGLPRLFESTTLTDLPCLHAGTTLKGVQVHDIEERINAYNGRVWYYMTAKPIIGQRLIDFQEFLFDQLGKEYDAIGAFRSGGKFFSWLEGLLREEDLNDIFCSELCAAARRVGGMLKNHNASRWNPAALLRSQVRDNALLIPKRMK